VTQVVAGGSSDVKEVKEVIEEEEVGKVTPKLPRCVTEG